MLSCLVLIAASAALPAEAVRFGGDSSAMNKHNKAIYEYRHNRNGGYQVRCSLLVIPLVQ